MTNALDTPAVELAEGTAGADLAFTRLGKRSAFIVNDQTAFGQSLARIFSERFTQDGGTVVDPSDLGAFDPNRAPQFGTRVDRAKELAADVIYYAGADIGSAAALRLAMLARRSRQRQPHTNALWLVLADAARWHPPLRSPNRR